MEEDYIVLQEERTDVRYGYPPYERPPEELLNWGVVVLDKPHGPTSHQVSAWVKEITGLKRAGHSGTLDPHTTGVLPVALGRATKALKYITERPKEYVALMRLHREVPLKRLELLFKEFTGEIYQTPPVRSAVKRQLRVRRIEYIKMLEVEGTEVLILVKCQAGTYVRTLIHDMGEVLGVGANMEELRRVSSGPFREEDAVTLHDLKDAVYFWREMGIEGELRRVVRPFEEIFQGWGEVFVKDSAVDALAHGSDLYFAGVVKLSPKIKRGERVIVKTLKGEAVCVGISQADARGYSKG
ncbi:MAG: RNA-guided pseudouridylation complex pseudouridine synthase subunit Cbf5, partial [Thermoplasmata archaeon]|nr:RNA-guided pseudouridylation complex pseudouridine synthase subunit Cbf5 [Thermoplasmata archaeon]